MEQMYKYKHDRLHGDDYVIVERLNHVVCLMNCRTNDLEWVTKHILKLDFIEKVSNGQ